MTTTKTFSGGLARYHEDGAEWVDFVLELGDGPDWIATVWRSEDGEQPTVDEMQRRAEEEFPGEFVWNTDDLVGIGDAIEVARCVVTK